MRAYIEGYGCTMSVGESREVRDLLIKRGWEIAQSPSQADLAVLAICVVIDKTEREMLCRVSALSQVPRLFVAGCMATTKCREKVEGIATNAQFFATSAYLGGEAEESG